jgi:hypothetical protein
MTMSPSSAAPSSSSSNGESFSSLPRWRQLLSMLNWRRDPDYEQRKMQHEWRMKQLENEILRVRSESEQIEKETERLRQENARLRQQRAREKAWRTSVEEFFSQPECSLTPQQAATEPDSRPSLP